MSASKTVSVASAKSVVKTTKKLTATEQSKAIRKGAERKVITANLRKIEKIRTSLEKATAMVSAESATLTGDVGTQLTAVLETMTLAITITTAEIESQANALARTFLAK